ncbi:MAG: hypothetical protein IID44_07665 [Planctomycetes bacterium]|nr:hypothetical protein [Planctomycetota bacterium]
MEARIFRAAILAACLCSLGASYRTTNFIVNASSDQFAKQIGQTAEQMRRDLAIEWVGRELPRWESPCPITVNDGPRLGAGGATSFPFDGGPLFCMMTIQGSKERILDSVLPHEVTHTVFATHFGRPLPRWADEGACTTVEHISERQKHHKMLVRFLRNGRGIAFNRLFAMKEYPSDIMPLYAQGYSLARYLIGLKGKRHFVNFIGDGMRDEQWHRAARASYGCEDLSALQKDWLEWVKRGSPNPKAAPAPLPTLVASGTPPQENAEPQARTPRPRPNLIYRVSRGGQVAQIGGADIAADDLVPVGPSEPGAARPAGVTLTSHTTTPAAGGWYSRNRGPAPPRPSASAVPSRPAPTRHQLSRPQPPQPSRQIILEWSRPPRQPFRDASLGGTMRR